MCLFVIPFTHGLYYYGMFLSAYLVTQSMPECYFRAYKRSIVFSIVLKQLVYYMSPYTVVRETMLDPKEKYIICWHPHGRVFYGFGALVSLSHEWFPELERAGRDIFAGINDVMFRMPFVNIWLQMCGTIPCSKRSLESKLSRGDSVALVVGGIEEILEGTFDDKDVLFLVERKGFCKLALDQGASLVPMFCFGENSIFAHTPRGGLFGLDWWRWANRTFGKVGVPFPVVGRAGLPFPFRRPMLVVVGPAVDPVAGDTVDSLHARYVAALRALHARHLAASPYPDRRLVLV